jgi:hypothetical protein
MLFRDRRVKFQSPQVEALAKASAAGARGIRATTAPGKDPGGWKKHDASMERDAVRSGASAYGDSVGDRGDKHQRAAQMVDMKLAQGKDAYGHGKSN